MMRKKANSRKHFGMKAKNLAKSKRSQAEVITSVLIILVVIVVLAVVAGFIIKNVRERTAAAGEKSSCIGLLFNVEEAINGSTSIKVGRGSDQAELVEVRVLVDGKTAGTYVLNATNTLGLQETSVITVTSLLSTGQVVEVVPVLK